MSTENPSGKDTISQQVEDAARQTAELTEGAVTETADSASEATSAAADAAGQVNAQAADMAAMAASFSSETAEAFGAARDRLQSLSGTPPVMNHVLLDQFKSSTETLGKGVEASYKHATGGLAEFNSKAIEAWRTNAEALIAHWQNLASVKSFSEAIAVNAEHTRRQMEAMTAQTRELSALAGRIARDAVDPLKYSSR